MDDELDDLRRERLFDSLLSAGDHWHMPLDAQAERAADTDAGVAEDLALLAQLRALQTGREETEFARARIARQLDELLYAEPMGAEAAQPLDAHDWMRSRLRALTAPPADELAAARRSAERQAADRAARLARRQAITRVVAGHTATLVGAALLLVCATLTGVSAAAARALPESPLYAVKRAEETTLLAISWGDVSRGQTLNMIANHRLTEAASEADLHRIPEAHSLLHQFDSTFTELITLTRHAQAQHEDTSSLTSGIQATVVSEQSIGATASAHGEVSFAAAVTSSAQSAMTQMQAAGIGTNPGHSHDHSNNGNHNGAGNGNGAPAQTPTPKPTHTPRTGSGSGAGPGGTVSTPTVGSTTPSANASITPSTSPSGAHNGNH
ncbi:MAG TPA: DUF5667 domain-containing protein [Ktedonobacterales bacterium]|jgi:hypothetical protein|nr:DUF5667 domain-containing protein [Ktedonobacterales bacterium]